MTKNKIKVGQTILHQSSPEITGDFVTLDNTEFYKISHYNEMRPFFISLVSHSDQWLFVSSKGGLTAGRKNPDNALFPYYTDDKIHDSNELSGSKTVLLVNKGEETYLWEPFSDRFEGAYQIERHLYKSIYGNQLIFEEHNSDLGLSFSYRWSYSQKLGLVKKSRLINHGDRLEVKILDGLQNLLPYGINPMMQSERSTLLDAYKKNELLTASGLGLFLLSSVPVDKAEPSEALKATTVWQKGLKPDLHLLSINQLSDFTKGKTLTQEVDIRAERGAYLIQSTFELSKEEEKTWYFVAELNQGPAQVVALHEWLQSDEAFISTIETDIKAGTQELINIVAASDGIQVSTDKILTTRHFANVLFNVMRGGIFDHHYDVPSSDLLKFLHQANPKVAAKHIDFLQSLPDTITYMELKRLSAESGDIDLQRLCLEYLPLTFSRRHGDPSRPWNRFSIELEDDLGNKKFYYQGNWRDIFQNWEALALSYPRFLESMITKFVNASTVDGYNPYRITRDGIDWEVIEEDDPWSFIGYWGDHQIIYLLRLMELSKIHHPKELHRMLLQKIYVYANVPYRIKGYEDLLKDPQDTILFDHEVHEQSEERIKTLGADGKLIQDGQGEIVYVNLTEKLLVSLLAKLSNYIPEGGIWLNTQRPEWNDANNALVGNGVSMVTLYYIRRFTAFCQSLFAELEVENVEISAEVTELFHAIAKTFENYQANLNQPRTSQLRRQILDELGQAGEIYRNKVYSGFSKEQTSITLKNLDAFFTNVLACTDHTIAANQRADKLFHSYNLMKVESDGGISIRYLYEMLEGQVAVLSTGILSPNETLEVVQALRDSQLYRSDQHSYILYPDRQLPRFEAKNEISTTEIMRSELLQAMVKNGDRRIIEQDIKGGYHFNGQFNNQRSVSDALQTIGNAEYGGLANTERHLILDVFEEVFDHQSFTGRSGTFFGYEGLGCIYWHMVSKLILAIEEECQKAIENGLDTSTLEALIESYYDLRKGLGFNKTPENYGAFPTDPYSHTPGNAGAQQPGMTGQVKEDIISRFGELGVLVQNGELIFRPRLLRKSEFLTTAETFVYVDLKGISQAVELPAASLAFTYCQVPVIYRLTDCNQIILHLQNGNTVEIVGLKMGENWSNHLFERTNEVVKIEVFYDQDETVFV